MTGLIVGGEPRDAALVEQLAEEYIKKESCIILVTIACESMFIFNNPPCNLLNIPMFTADYENQKAHRLAAHFDPYGTRTIGISTLHAVSSSS